MGWCALAYLLRRQEELSIVALASVWRETLDSTGYYTPARFMADLVTVASFDSGPKAHLARTLLESEGIAAYVVGDQALSSNPILMFYPGVAVRVQVSADDLEKAQRILGVPSVECRPEPGFDCCPKCGSKEIQKYADPRTHLAWSNVFVLIGILLGLRRRARKCKECGYRRNV